jgi:hypothetical protein
LAVIGHSAALLHSTRNGQAASRAHAACPELFNLGRNPDR